MVKQNELTPSRGGSIITMSSVNAVLAIPTTAGYNAAKGGVSSLTRCCRLRRGMLRDRGVPIAHVLPVGLTCN